MGDGVMPVDQVTAALWQVWAAKWQVGIGIANVIAIGVFSYLIWRATQQMTDLSKKMEEEKREKEKRAFKSYLYESIRICEDNIKTIEQLTIDRPQIIDDLLPLPNAISNLDDCPTDIFGAHELYLFRNISRNNARLIADIQRYFSNKPFNDLQKEDLDRLNKELKDTALDIQQTFKEMSDLFKDSLKVF